MARLFISYKRQDQAYAFAIRHWLIETQGWTSDEIFIDREDLRGGDKWADKIFAEAEAAEVMLFLASEESLAPKSFCFRELQHAKGVVLAVTLKGLAVTDERLLRALPYGASARQIAALDGPPTEVFEFTSPIDGQPDDIRLNRAQVESIGQTLRDLGVAPTASPGTRRPTAPIPASRRCERARRRCSSAETSRSATPSARLKSWRPASPPRRS